MTQQEQARPREPHTVVLLHQDRLIGEGIAGILRENGFDVLGLLDSEDGLFEMDSRPVPDICMIDCCTLARDGNIVASIRDRLGSRVVVLVHPEHQGLTVDATRAGAAGCLSVQLCPNDFLESLRILMKGATVISSELMGAIQHELNGEPQRHRGGLLSDREKSILELVGRGNSNKEIADILIISEHTVKAHLRSILNKLDLRNRQQIVAYAVREGMVEQSERHP